MWVALYGYTFRDNEEMWPIFKYELHNVNLSLSTLR